MNKHIIKEKANKICKIYGANNPFAICKEKDYIVKKIPMPLRLKGYTTTKIKEEYLHLFFKFIRTYVQ